MPSLPAHLNTVADKYGAAVHDVSRNQITILNSTGGFVWERLQQGRTVEQAIQDLACECNTDPSIVQSGVRAFLGQLESEHLLSN